MAAGWKGSRNDGSIVSRTYGSGVSIFNLENSKYVSNESFVHHFLAGATGSLLAATQSHERQTGRQASSQLGECIIINITSSNNSEGEREKEEREGKGRRGGKVDGGRTLIFIPQSDSERASRVGGFSVLVTRT